MPPSSVSVSSGSETPIPASGPVPFNSSPSVSESLSESGLFGSVSPLPAEPVAPMVFRVSPSRFASSWPSLRPSLSESKFAGSVVVAGSASATKLPAATSVPVKLTPAGWLAPPAMGVTTPASVPSSRLSSSLSGFSGLVSSKLAGVPSRPSTSSPSLRPSSSVSASNGFVSAASRLASGPTSAPSVSPSLSVSGSSGSVPRASSCAFDKPSLSGSAAASSAPEPATGFVLSAITSVPSNVPPSSVSLSSGSVAPMPASGPVAFTSSPSCRPSPSVSACAGSVSPEPAVLVAPMVLTVAPS